MLLKTDFEADWIVEMRRIMEEHWAMNLASAQTEELAALFFHARTRRVEPRPRAVHLSNAFACPLEHEAGWAELKDKIEAGKDLSPHLSLKIESFKGKDGLLLDWGIYHFHLGQAQHAKNKSFVERTGPVVFGFPTDDAFHAVGIYQHGAWSDSSVIETLHANWPHLTQAAKMQGSGMSLGQHYTDDDRKMLRATGINLITPLSDGSFLLPLGGGYSGNGISAQAVTDAELERQRIHRLQNLIHDRADAVARALKAEGYTGNTEVVGRLNFGNGVQWVSFDGFRVCFAV